jgi:hypothetical protein
MTERRDALRPQPDVVDTDLDGGEVALLHLGSKTFFSLNLTGARIWTYLKDGLSLDAIAVRLQEEFDVGADQAARSVRRIADELVEHDLVKRGTP